MKYLLAIAMLLTVFTIPVSADDTAAAQKAATSWLALVDAGNYSVAWDQAAAVVKSKAPRDGFSAAVGGVRTKVGALHKRTLKSATPMTNIPNAPPGHYVVLLYSTSFANMPNATETVTPMLEKDGKWRVSGYYIH
ncbi:MAG TPA: DUF4019 domain-containing protein [Candidatus Xenobia bacterium]|jgi:hypothetical protein